MNKKLKKAFAAFLAACLLMSAVPLHLAGERSAFMQASAAAAPTASGHRAGKIETYTTQVIINDPNGTHKVTDIVFNGTSCPVHEEDFTLSVAELEELVDEYTVAHFKDGKITGFTLLGKYNTRLAVAISPLTLSHDYSFSFFKTKKLHITGNVTNNLPTVGWSEEDKALLAQFMQAHNIGAYEQLTLELHSENSDTVYFNGVTPTASTVIDVTDLLAAGDTGSFETDLYINTSCKPADGKQEIAINYALRTATKDGIVANGQTAVTLIDTSYEEPIITQSMDLEELLVNLHEASLQYNPEGLLSPVPVQHALQAAISNEELKKAEGIYSQFENLQVVMDMHNMISGADVGGVIFTVADSYLEELLSDIEDKAKEMAGYNDSAIRELFETEDFKAFLRWYEKRCRSLNSYANGNAHKIENKCPTDVRVYDENGNTVLTILADTVTVYNDRIFADCTNGHKTFYLPTDIDYRVEITATDNGEMDYIVSCITPAGAQRVITYKDIPIRNADCFEAQVQNRPLQPSDAYNLVSAAGEIIVCDSDTLPPAESNFADVVVAEGLFADFPLEAVDAVAAAMFNMLPETDLTDFAIPLEQAVALFSAISKYFPVKYSLLTNTDFSYRIVYNAQTQKIVKILFDYGKNASLEKYLSRVAAVQTQLDAIVAQMQGMDTFEKVLFAHDYIVRNCEYDTGLLEILEAGGTLTGEIRGERYSEYAVLVNGTGICGSYALAYRAILNAAGVECLYLSSAAMNHAWNMVRIDGQWYHVDCCWDDPLPDAEGKAGRTFFLRTDSEMMQLSHFAWTPADYKATSEKYTSMPRFDDSRQKYDIVNDCWYVLAGSTVYRSDADGKNKHAAATDIHADAIACDNGRLYFSKGRWVYEYTDALQKPVYVFASYEAGTQPDKASYVNLFINGDCISYYKNTIEYRTTENGSEQIPAVTFVEDALKTQQLEAVTGIEIDNTELAVELFGQSYLYAWLVSDRDAWDLDITWSSSDENVATVDGWGTVYALNTGTTVITASFLDFSVSCVVTVVPGSSAPPETVVAGSLNEKIRWELNKETGVLTVSGSGAIPDYEHGTYSQIPWYAYYYETKEIVISPGITDIGNYAFYNRAYLEKVSIPDSVCSIGMYAFYGCQRLDNVVIPASVKIMEHDVFFMCRNLKNITLPATLERIENSAFAYCAFTRMDIPAGVTFIGQNAFMNCLNLASVTLPDGLQTVEYSAFQYTAITEITIPASVTQWDPTLSTVFWGCDKLEKILVAPDNPILSNDANGVLFNKDKTLLLEYPRGRKDISYTVPDSVTDIARNSFAFAPHLQQIILPTGVKSIGFCAFRGCEALQHVAYCGTNAAFKQITVDSDNEFLTNAPHMHYSFDADAVIAVRETPASCTANGSTAGLYCTVCDCPVGCSTIPATGHEYTVSNHVAGSCTQAAYDIYTCTRCSDSYTVSESAFADHAYKQTIIAPTCTKAGYTLAVCTLCGETAAFDITPPIGHNLVLYVSDSFCMAHGTQEYACTRCSYRDLIIVENASIETQPLVTPATCSESGTEKEICLLCGAALHTEKIPPTGIHEWDDGEITRPPTAEVQGEKTFTCIHCNATKTEAVEYIPPAEPVLMYGDIDGNGVITANDARTALRASVGLDILTSEQQLLADTDGDGRITAADARFILRYSVGLETEFPR